MSKNDNNQSRDEKNVVEYLRVIDYERCIGCETCESVCSFLHDGHAYIKLFEISRGFLRPISCFHCRRAPCIIACPTGAMQRDKDGAVYVDESRCIGCLACLAACPFGIPTLSSITKTAVKCDLCMDLRKKGLEPACYAMCPSDAILYGKTENIFKTLQKRALIKVIGYRYELNTQR